MFTCLSCSGIGAAVFLNVPDIPDAAGFQDSKATSRE